MAVKLLFAFATLAVVTAAPLTDIRAAIFCDSWSPLGTDYLPRENPYEYYCGTSSDKRSLTMRVIARDPEDSYKYLMMAAVDSDGNALIEGDYKVDHRLRTLHCDEDKSTRVLKVDDEKITDIIATYHLPENKEATLDGVYCRFAVATSFETYYRDVTVDQRGKIISGGDFKNETDIDVEMPEIDVEAPVVDVEVPEVDNSTDINVQEPMPHQPTEVVVEVTDNQETDATGDDTENFIPSGTVDETDDLQMKFKKEEILGHETDGGKDVKLTVVAPDVPEEKDELKNEGEEIKPVFITDEFGLQKMVMTEKEEKVIYKGEPTGYWCSAFANTYVMAKGTDCRMFYQTIMNMEESREVFPLSSTTCPPGTRFNIVKCICDFYEAIVCPDPNPDFKVTSEKPDKTQIFTGNEVDTSFNQTETVDAMIESGPTQFNQTQI